MADDDPSKCPDRTEEEPKDQEVVKAERALSEAKGKLMEGKAIWKSLLSINPCPGLVSAIADDKKKLTASIDAAMASLQRAKAALEPGNVGGRRRKTRKGKVGRKAKKGTRRH